MNNRDIVFKLIQSAFKNEVFHFESQDEKELTKMIYENGLTGLVFNVIDKMSYKEQKYYQKLKQTFGAFVSKDVQQQFIMNQLKDVLNEHEIKHVFLKGAHLKTLYPESYMRGMGDIDILVLKTEFAKVKAVLIKMGCKFESAAAHHHVYSTSDGNYIELHQSLVSIVEYEQAPLLEKAWQHTFKSSDYTYLFEKEFEYCYLLSHLVRHIRTTGVGIRSVLDIQVYLEKNDYLMDDLKIESYLNQFNLFEFSQKIKRINQIFFGVVKPDKSDDQVIDYVMKSGIHGKGTDHDSYITKRTHESTRMKKSKFKYLMQELFPARTRIQEAYPYLKKHPWLLPWAWIVRIFKQVFTKPKDSKKRLKAVTSDENSDEVKHIYDYFGI